MASSILLRKQFTPTSMAAKRALSALASTVLNAPQISTTATFSAAKFADFPGRRNDVVSKYRSPSRLDFTASFGSNAAGFAVVATTTVDYSEDEWLEISKIGISEDVVNCLSKRGINKFFPLQMVSVAYTFGPYKIDWKEVFYSTKLSYAMVNLRPLLPGHVLVCPRREVKRFADLTVDETCDLWLTAQKVGSQLEIYHKASSLTLAIQDGPQAGQTVSHVHIHILPRKGGDFEKNDEIYDAIDVKEKELAQKLDLDKDRKDRTLEEMNQEAEEYRALFT